MSDTLPAAIDVGKQPAVIVAAVYSDPVDHSLYVHKDLVNVRAAYTIGPPEAEEDFGDVDSWAAYVKSHAGARPPFLTWSSTGLHAVLDYHSGGDAGRLRWTADLPFDPSPEWLSWMGIATGHGIPQAKAVEFLDDHSPDITDPDAATLMTILSSLRANANKSAQTDMRPDGTSSVTWSDNKTVAGRGGTADLPPEFTITIPILKGHDQRYKLGVKVRVSVDDQARLALRFSIPLADQALEMVYAKIVAEAKALLGDGFSVLRAAG